MIGWVDGTYRWLPGRVHLYADGSSYDANGTVMLLDPVTAFGFSGGPVLDRDGRVVAVLMAIDMATDLTLAIPVSELSSWLDINLDKGRSTRCIGGTTGQG